MAQPQIVYVTAPPVAMVTEKYCGPITWLIGCFICPCVCFCPCDERQVPVSTVTTVYGGEDGDKWWSGDLETFSFLVNGYRRETFWYEIVDFIR